MSKISLDQFIQKTIGTQVDVSWGEGELLGQCTSLMQQYLGQCYNINQHARGNAKDWKDSLVAEGVGQAVDVPQRGDVIVFYDPYYGKGLGHLAIYIDENTMYDQNNGYHDNCCAGYCNLAYTGNDFKWGYVYIRPIPQPEPAPQPELAPSLSTAFNIGDKVVINGPLYSNSGASTPVGNVINKITEITRKAEGTAHPYNTTGDLGWMDESCITKYVESTPEPAPIPEPSKKFLILPAEVPYWGVYDMGVQPIEKNVNKWVSPSKFGGLRYEIQGWTMDNVAIITTRDYGQVQIYVGPETGAQFE